MIEFVDANVVKRWGFYFKNRLAYAGFAIRESASRVSVHLFEAEHHPHTSSLPERMSHEQQVREQAVIDIQREFGRDCQTVFQFNPIRCSEHRLAQAVFGALVSAPTTGN